MTLGNGDPAHGFKFCDVVSTKEQNGFVREIFGEAPISFLDDAYKQESISVDFATKFHHHNVNDLRKWRKASAAHFTNVFQSSLWLII